MFWGSQWTPTEEVESWTSFCRRQRGEVLRSERSVGEMVEQSWFVVLWCKLSLSATRRSAILPSPPVGTVESTNTQLIIIQIKRFLQFHITLGPNYKNILWFFIRLYLKLDHTSIVCSRPTGTMPYDLSYDYRRLITKWDLRASSLHRKFVIRLW